MPIVRCITQTKFVQVVEFKALQKKSDFFGPKSLKCLNMVCIKILVNSHTTHKRKRKRGNKRKTFLFSISLFTLVIQMPKSVASYKFQELLLTYIEFINLDNLY